MNGMRLFILPNILFFSFEDTSLHVYLYRTDTDPVIKEVGRAAGFFTVSARPPEIRCQGKAGIASFFRRWTRQGRNTAEKESLMTHKILIAYASKSGTTEEVAREIGKVFAEREREVEVVPARNVNDISPYDGIILGTAVRIGQPLNDAVGFVKKFRETLGEKKVALFSVGIQMREDTPENRETAKGFLAPIIRIIGEPVGLGLFAGRMDRNRLGFFLRLFAKIEKTGVFNEGDWRNWEEIRRWAEGLIQQNLV
jgi:menaquinone-dependent protoporphyrinogen oxidase